MLHGMGSEPSRHEDDATTICACSTPATTPAATGRSASPATWCSTRATRACRSRYPLALGWGFRRSGDIVYRPHCHGCRACVAVRIPVDRFAPDRSQRRCLARNADVELRVLPAERTDEQLALYRRYLVARHAGGGMDGHGAAEFDQFLIGSWAQGRFLELRERGTHRPAGGRGHRCASTTRCRRSTRSTTRTKPRAAWARWRS